MFCSKCGGKLPDNARFCGKCGASVGDDAQPAAWGGAPVSPLSRAHTPTSASVGSAHALTAALAQIPLISAGCMCAAILFYILWLLGWPSLTFWGFLLNIAAPGAFAAILFAKGKGQPRLFLVPFGIAAFVSLISFFSYPGSIYSISHLAHIALAILFFLTLTGKLKSRAPLLITSGGATVVVGLISLRAGGLFALSQFLYFGAVALLTLDVGSGASSAAGELLAWMRRSVSGLPSPHASASSHIPPTARAPAAETPVPPARDVVPDAPQAPPVHEPPAPPEAIEHREPITAAPSNPREIHLPSRETSGELISTVPYKGNGESVRFYDDHLEFGGYNIGYEDISVMDTYAVETSGYAAIVVYGSFDGFIRFTLYSGEKIKIKIYGFSLYGIGAKRSARKRYPPLFNAAYKIVAKAMADRALAHVMNGETVTLAGMEVSRDSASYKKLLRKEPVVISKYNFGSCSPDGYSVRVLDKEGKRLFVTSDDSANALLMPYVLGALFGE
jgi:hypothetical protein